jgi:hypothetical protein
MERESEGEMSMPRVGAEEDEERRRQRKLEEALEVKSLRRIVSAYLKYAYFLLRLGHLYFTFLDFFFLLKIEL